MSKKITLIKAAQVPIGGRVRPSGFSSEVDDATFETLLERGVIIAEGVEDADVPVDDDAQSDPAVAHTDGAHAEGADVDAPVDEPAVTGKPKPTDSVEKHRDFLKKHGVDPKGLTRPQLVKAVAAIEI